MVQSMHRLIIKSEGFKSRSIELAPGLNRLGRGPDNHHILDDASVSTHHCEIEAGPGEIRVRDLGSTNGTFVNGIPVSESMVHTGQTLKLGRVEMLYEWIEISIPEFRKPAPAPQALPDGALACVNHAESPARMSCVPCGKAFCEECLHTIRRIGGASLTLCPVCGSPCQVTNLPASRPRRKSGLGLWIGKLTVKVAGFLPGKGSGTKK